MTVPEPQATADSQDPVSLEATPAAIEASAWEGWLQRPSPQVSACTRGWRASGQGTASTPQGTCTGAAHPLLLSPPSVSPPSHGRGSARSVLSSGSQPCWWLRACGLRPRVREGPLSGRIPVTAQFRPGGKRDLSKAPAPQGDLSPSVSRGQPRRGVTSGEPPLK